MESLHYKFTVAPIDVIDPDFAIVSGKIVFNENITIEDVKKIFKLSLSNNQQAPDFTIESTDQPTTFSFKTANIERIASEVTLSIEMDGAALKIEQKSSEKIIIPAKNVFEVMDVQLMNDDESELLVAFSDPLSSVQDLKGLITLSIGKANNNDDDLDLDWGTGNMSVTQQITDFSWQITANKLEIWFDRTHLDQLMLTIHKEVKNYNGKSLEVDFQKEVRIAQEKPQVVILEAGNIIPNAKELLLPFKAVSLKAIDIKVIKIYESNILMFLQDNDLNEGSALRRSGRLVYKKTLHLDHDPSIDLNEWNNYSIDLSEMMLQDKGAIYRIELSFKKEYSNYPCGASFLGDNKDKKLDNQDNLTKIAGNEITEKEEASWDEVYPYYYADDDYDWYEYDWREVDNPCHVTYYMTSNKKSVRNVMMSNIGVIAKSNTNNQWWITVSNIMDAAPIANAELTLYNYQLQKIGNAKTDVDGCALMTSKGRAFVLTAEANGQKSYLKLIEGQEKPLNMFDIGGKKIEKGLKGYIYGERGVWRPGDTLFVTFILEDKENKIPKNHPVSFELFNPQGQFYTKKVLTQDVNNFYAFAIPTDANDPTGLWNGYVKVGGTSFHQSFRIETVKPNRLKINLSLPDKIINPSSNNVLASLSATWLTGIIANDLAVKIEMTLSKSNANFKGFENYIFNNPTAKFYNSTEEVFTGKLDQNGKTTAKLKVPTAKSAPGMLNANLVCRVFEKGGDASIYSENFLFSPFDYYVGINFNRPKMLYFETDKDLRFDIITVDAQGKLSNRKNIEYKIYKIGWSWWWEEDSYSSANYVNNSSYEPVAKGTINTVNGKGTINFRVNYPNWGRYLVYVVDRESGHATGGTVIVDWPSWQGRADKSDPSHLSMLSFSTDKSSYEIGEEISVIIPAAPTATAIITFETGNTILKTDRVKMNSKGDTKYTFKATKEMAPNFYIHVMLIQPHGNIANDMPIRMYGVVPILISNKNSHLEPQISMPDVLRPETPFTVDIKEKSGKAMTYTIAIVDEGLLDLTNFKTPDPWKEFNIREALGINTWDIYDNIMGAFAGKYASTFTIGGDGELKQGEQRANRFNPIVKYLGPFTLAKGGHNTHKVTLPVYVGSVRTMVVAAQDYAYGKAEKTTPVRSSLMLLSSLPRVISTDEEISLPVNIFAMENSVKKCVVKVETTGLLKLKGNNNTEINFAKTGDQMVYFDMQTGTKTGIEKVKITATGGGKTSQETIEIEVRNPNPPIVLCQNRLVAKGEKSMLSYPFIASSPNNWVKMEISRIPAVNINSRFDFLHNYPHYCSEQVTSAAMPLLFIAQFKEVDNKENEQIKTNIRSAIKNLYSRQLSEGGFVYWSGQTSANEWISTYVGHFLILAKEKGYEVNESVLNKWKKYQKKRAQNWKAATEENYFAYEGEYGQAYRLYSLALAGSPELGAMNRLKESKNLSTQARWRLAAAYALCNQKKAAEELIANTISTIADYYGGVTYGSSDRDNAMILETMILMGHLDKAFTQAQQLAQKLSQQNRFETQSTAYSLLALGMLAEKTSGTIDFNWTLNGEPQKTIKSSKAIYQMDLPKKAAGKIEITNNGSGLLFFNLTSKYIPPRDTLPAISRDLRINVIYTNLSGKAIDITKIKQGTDFIATIKVTNISALNVIKDIALSYIIPSGWEIFNERMLTEENNTKLSKDYTCQDLRDDRVLTYFDLTRGATKTFLVRLQATYAGSFILPAVQCEAMYYPSAYAKTKSERVTVEK
ncbi:MAG: alpha-2-macroglobulin [Bacteroidales bacterium]|nr:alpha-2-macroglobulin [Bacteroidales bacterium]